MKRGLRINSLLVISVITVLSHFAVALLALAIPPLYLLIVAAGGAVFTVLFVYLTLVRPTSSLTAVASAMADWSSDPSPPAHPFSMFSEPYELAVALTAACSAWSQARGFLPQAVLAALVDGGDIEAALDDASNQGAVPLPVGGTLPRTAAPAASGAAVVAAAMQAARSTLSSTSSMSVATATSPVMGAAMTSVSSLAPPTRCGTAAPGMMSSTADLRSVSSASSALSAAVAMRHSSGIGAQAGPFKWTGSDPVVAVATPAPGSASHVPPLMTQPHPAHPVSPRLVVASSFRRVGRHSVAPAAPATPQPLRPKQIAVMVVTLPAFSAMCAALTPDALLTAHGAYVRAVHAAVRRYAGVCEPFVGDVIVVSFNASARAPAPAVKACNAALAVVAEVRVALAQMPTVAAALPTQPLPSLAIASSGALCGVLGPDGAKRMSFIGPCAIRAHVLERLRRSNHVHRDQPLGVVVDDNTLTEVSSLLPHRVLDRVRIIPSAAVRGGTFLHVDNGGADIQSDGPFIIGELLVPPQDERAVTGAQTPPSPTGGSGEWMYRLRERADADSGVINSAWRQYLLGDTPGAIEYLSQLSAASALGRTEAARLRRVFEATPHGQHVTTLAACASVLTPPPS